MAVAETAPPTMTRTRPSQAVVSLPLAPAVRRALLTAGLGSMADLRGMTEAHLVAGACGA
jgi:hypothetical protein